MIAGAMLNGPAWRHHSTLVAYEWFIPRTMCLVVVLAAPWLGAWGEARVLFSRGFTWQLRLTAAAVFLAANLSLFVSSAQPATSVWIPIAAAVLLAEAVTAGHTLVCRVLSLAPVLAASARRLVWAGALTLWLARIGAEWSVSPLWEGPVATLRPLARALVGEQPAYLPLAVSACIVLILHLSARHLSARRPPASLRTA